MASKCYCVHVEVWVILKRVSLDISLGFDGLEVLLRSCRGLGYSQKKVSLDISLGFDGLEVLLRSCRGASKCYCIHVEVWFIPKGVSLDISLGFIFLNGGFTFF